MTLSTAILEMQPSPTRLHASREKPMSDLRIETIKADITRLTTDAIVNAANSSLLGGGGVDGAIHRAAGPALLAHCRTIGGCPTGEARITPAFALPSKWIIHTVGPVWQGGNKGEADLLAGCYRSCLVLAAAHSIRTIAFPAISCGVYGYPAATACRIAVRTIKMFETNNTTLERVLLVAYDDHTASLMKQALDGAD